MPRLYRVSCALLLAGALGSVLGHASAQTPTQTQAAPAQATQTQAAILTLADLYNLLEQSPAVQQAKLGVETARRNLAAAQTALGLTVSAAGNANYTGAYGTTIQGPDGKPKNVSVDADASGSLGLRASLGVLPWSTTSQNLDAGRRGLELAEAQLSAVSAATRLNVAKGYLSAVLAAQDLKLAQRSLRLQQRQLQITQVRLNDGTAVQTDLLNAQNAVADAEASVLAAQRGLSNARRSLETALGTSLGSAQLAEVPASSPRLPDLEPMLARARTETVEVIKAKGELADAVVNYNNRARQLHLPDLELNLRYGPAGAGGLSAGLDLQDGTANVGYTQLLGVEGSENRLEATVRGSYVLFSPALRARLAAAESQVAQAQLGLSVAAQQAELDVRTSYAAAESALLSADSAQTQVQVAQRELETAQARLQAGVATSDDVSAAGFKLAQAQRDLTNARKDAQIALIQLYNAAALPTGGTQ